MYMITAISSTIYTIDLFEKSIFSFVHVMYHLRTPPFIDSFFKSPYDIGEKSVSQMLILNLKISVQVVLVKLF